MSQLCESFFEEMGLNWVLKDSYNFESYSRWKDVLCEGIMMRKHRALLDGTELDI